MKISRTAQKKLLKLPQEEALMILDSLHSYKRNNHGYVKWLEGRPGYRIKIRNTHAIFDLVGDEIHTLDLMQRE